MVHATLCAPSRLVLCHSVLQVEHWVFLLGCLVIGRCIYHSAAPLLLTLGIVFHRAHLTFCHSSLRTVVITFLTFSYLNLTCHTTATEDGVGVGIRHSESIHFEEVIVIAHNKWVGHTGPYSMNILLHRVFLSANIHNNTACLGGKYCEVSAVFHIE